MKDRGIRKQRVLCHKCVHFFVTWDKRFPRGCRAMNFKSRRMPSLVVYESSGMECQKFTPKPS